MRKHSIKTLFCIICLVAMLVSLAACDTSKPARQDVTPTAAPSAQEQQEQPVKIRFVSSDFSKPFPSGNQANIPEIKYLREKLNIDLEIEMLSHTEYNELWRMRVASGDVGDFFLGYGAGDSIVANGGVQVLTDLVKQYAPDALKIVSDEQWKVNTYKGEIVGLPSMPISQVMQVLYVRKDWLDKLGLEIPKTSEEFLDMLRAFRDRDPNGNGQKDEIPFSSRAGHTWIHNVEGMFGHQGGNHVMYDGKITISCLTPQTKEYLAFLKKMYDEGLIDSEFMMNQRAQWEQKIQSGLVGAWVHNVDLAWDWQKRLNEGCPEQNPVVVPINTPVGIFSDGTKSEIHGSYVNPWTACWLVSKDCKNPEAVVKLYNFLLTEEGVAFKELGIPGLTYEVQNGKYVYYPEKDKEGEWRTFVFSFGPYIPEIKMARDGEESVKAIQYAIDIASSDAPSIPADIGIIGLTQTGLLSDLRNTRWPELIAQIVTGQKPMDYFDTWAKEQTEILKPYLDEINQLAKEQLGQ